VFQTLVAIAATMVVAAVIAKVMYGSAITSPCQTHTVAHLKSCKRRYRPGATRKRGECPDLLRAAAYTAWHGVPYWLLIRTAGLAG
jgi:hypothetical protein